MGKNVKNRIEVFLDGSLEPIASYEPPARFELDTTLLEDGPHFIKIVASDSSGHNGVRKINFEVCNGPGIVVDGLNENDVVEGKTKILINAFSDTHEKDWDPVLAETPSPVPTWAWIIVILVIAWGLFYAIDQWKPGPKFANTPTYGNVISATQMKPKSKPQPKDDLRRQGALLYKTNCASCHQDNGQGLPAIFPPLAGDPVVTSASATRHIEIVLFGLRGKKIKGVSYASPMVAWGNQLSDKKIAAIINHERTSWGNNAPTVTIEQVAAVRKKNEHPK